MVMMCIVLCEVSKARCPDGQISLVFLIYTLSVDKEISRVNLSERVDKSVDKKHTVYASSELRRKSKLIGQRSGVRNEASIRYGSMQLGERFLLYKEAQNKKNLKAPCNVRYKMRYNVSDFYYFTRGRYPHFKCG